MILTLISDEHCGLACFLVLNDGTYQILKFCGLVALPAAIARDMILANLSRCLTERNSPCFASEPNLLSRS